ncbi:MAG TPA: hypothetical protein VIF15_03990 [Polyangiaceae bacterium]
MRTNLRWAIAVLTCLGALLVSGLSWATPQLKYVYGGTAGTVVFIHGASDCSTSMTGCNSSDATTGPVGYWTNDAYNYNMLNEATLQYGAGGAVRFEAFSIGYDLNNQGFCYSANDVGACLADLYQGTNNSGCNPSRYQRSQFRLVTHSAGATIVDRLLSTGWWGVNSHVTGYVVALAPALAGSRSSSALYGTDGYGNFCTSFVSWVAGSSFKNNGAASLTRGAVIGEANKGYAGRSPTWFLKITTTGGSASANNAGCVPVFGCGWSSGSVNVNEHDNDENMGILAGCEGYGSSDDMDGLLYWSDSDPTNNTGGNGCNTSDTAYGGVNSCHYYSQFSGAYWHWFTSWANHSHSRDDAYTTLGDWQSTAGCYFRSPGTCVGQYGL